jgi:hypothetical protein
MLSGECVAQVGADAEVSVTIWLHNISPCVLLFSEEVIAMPGFGHFGYFRFVK